MSNRFFVNFLLLTTYFFDIFFQIHLLIQTPDNSHWRGFSLPAKQSLFEEIRRINEQLIDTVVSVCDKDTIATDPAATIDRSEGIIVKCSFVAHSNLTSHQTSALQVLEPIFFF